MALDGGGNAADVTFENRRAGIANRSRTVGVIKVSEGECAGVEYVLNRGVGVTAEGRRASYPHCGLRLRCPNKGEGKDAACH